MLLLSFLNVNILRYAFFFSEQLKIHICYLILFCLFSVEENVERDAVHKALLSLLRQDVRGNFAVVYSYKSV